MAAPTTPPTVSTCCSLSAGLLTHAEADRYAQLFKVLADPTRLRLLSQLAEDGCGPISVSELAAQSGLSQPTVSHHLKKLTDAGLTSKTRQGKTVTHQVLPGPFAELRTVLQMD
ncbi:ArsR/SmtB family transcription factor [Corynebacterium aquatimens]|uniref:ArsR family transcriptional regulator n=1 Tax=Corynebacterium aquatimens TaxID=1190508 RepID=A0A931E1R2_9CORY|nr:metalloregulator ArsR/SmtB family transcription factor [Corynebacterium aquatimens]MBG6123139.1 ArsR family transcriptional regulator [Corynebacterium aquatimens]WJY66530.1 HTH-type transcriptional regulator KmtR [Corynebacterium aquatimens]